MKNHEKWMKLCINFAQTAYDLNEVPIGALIIKNDQLISIGYNAKESRQNPLYHAEIIAINRAAQCLGSWRLNDCHLYVTLEPCIMCAGAIYQSRIATVTYGAADPKAGALGSLYQINQDNRLNHRYEVRAKILENECQAILVDFFKKKRLKMPVGKGNGW